MSEDAAAPVANAAAAGNNGSEQPQQQSTWSAMSGMMFRFLMMWMFMQWIRGGAKQETQTTPGAPATAGGPARNRFTLGTEMSLWVFVNEEEVFTDFTNPDALFWRKDGLVFGDWTAGDEKDGIFSYSNDINLSDNVQ